MRYFRIETDTMIIRITVNDRKYTNQLKSFANVMNECDKYYNNSILDNSEQIIADDRYKYDFLYRQIVNGNANEPQIDEFIQIVKSKFVYYCNKYPFVVLMSEEKEYMLNHISIEVIRSLVPKDENDEVVYIFPSVTGLHNQTIIL